MNAWVPLFLGNVGYHNRIVMIHLDINCKIGKELIYLVVPFTDGEFYMGITDMLKDSYEYTKTALIPNWGRWIALMVCAGISIPLIALSILSFNFGVILLALVISLVAGLVVSGYGVRVMKSEPEIPTLEGIEKLLIDGLLLVIITFVYALPALLVGIIFAIGSFDAIVNGNISGFIASAGIGFILFIILAIIFGMLSAMASVRFAREGRFGAAFEFGEVLSVVKSYGWLNLFVAFLVLEVILGLIIFILQIIPIVGWILLFILLPAFAIVQYRYYALIYDQAA